MNKNIYEDFDGYETIAREAEMSRKYGIDYSADTHAPEPYINMLHPSRLSLRVIDIIEETPSTKTIRLAADDGYLPPFQAGQYISLYLEIGPIRTSRPYSLSSPPNQLGHYEITVRRVEGGLVSGYLLDELKRGDRLVSSGPAGHFYFNPLFHDRTMVCLAGGSGVTPFMSMIREVVERGLNRNVILFCGSKTPGEVIFHQELEDLASRFENIRYIPVVETPQEGYKGETGLITGDLVKRTIGTPDNKTFYLCGPKGMYDFCLPALEEIGVPRRKIRTEVYGPPLNIWESPGWPEGVGGEDTFALMIHGDTRVEARAGESVLTTLEKNGRVVPSLCRSGECSMCRVRVLAGRVFQPTGVAVRKSDRRFGYIHACVSYPIEDLEILI
jgi:ferredoxin-NADP reductase